MDDQEFVRWLQRGQVVIIGQQLELCADLEAGRPAAGVEFSELAQAYDPCRADNYKLCLYCPWDRCYRPTRSPA